eukprot:SAG22_NODE_531_length_9422_cov_86.532983_6_plen_511_part_00
MSLRFVGSAAELESAAPATVVLLGHQAPLLEWIGSAGERISSTVLPQLAAGLTPGTDDGAVAETVIAAAGGALRRVAVAMLPTACSRHNSPAHPHATTTLLRGLTKGSGAIGIVLVLSDPSHALAAAAAVARAYPSYSLKSGGSTPGTVTVALVGAAGAADVTMAGLAAAGVRKACALVDTPTNVLHTTAFVAEAQATCAALQEKFPHVSIKVIEGEELKEQGLGGIFGVGKAACHPPALVVMSYTPPAATKSVCWVGKGIVYDTGGLSIKGKESMPGMKTDMGGAAAVLAAFEAAVAAGGPSNSETALHALLCLAENSISGDATRPDDVHTFLSGKTVEVNNTDAEGRLVLGDGCAWAANFLDPELIVDLATLTGAQGISTGRRHAAMYASTERAEAHMLAAGRASGDLTHAMPYVPEFYRAEFKSAIADMKNSVADRSNAQVSCAAQFIGNHIEDYINAGKDWVHVDMASPSTDKATERGTGWGVAILLHAVGLGSATGDTTRARPKL